ncbi:MAG: hypothetical protein N2689_00730 [Verrucomicrobiae bacterium]|nr:hypothetical protein [Verrucomicrobiae bacterium]
MKQLLKPHPPQAGQAMAEMVVALVAMVVIMVGIITFGDGGYQYVRSILEMSGSASQEAIDPNSVGTPVNFDFYSSWHHVLSNPVDYPNYLIQNDIEKQHNLDYRMSSSNGEAFWTRVYSQSSAFAPRVDLGDALQQLIYGGTITIDSGSFCWPRLTDLDKP